MSIPFEDYASEIQFLNERKAYRAVSADVWQALILLESCYTQYRTIAGHYFESERTQALESAIKELRKWKEMGL